MTLWETKQTESDGESGDVNYEFWQLSSPNDDMKKIGLSQENNGSFTNPEKEKRIEKIVCEMSKW